jgi:hypothetical protein
LVLAAIAGLLCASCHKEDVPVGTVALGESGSAGPAGPSNSAGPSSSSRPPDSSGASNPPAETSLTDADFAKPWVFLDRLAADRSFDAVIRGPSGFVAITHAPTTDGKANPSRNNIAATSADGLTWEQHPLGNAVHARAVAYGNGVIVAVGQRMGAGNRGPIFTSTDGKNWTEGPGVDVGLMALKYVAGKFWAFGEQGAFFTSLDGTTWLDQSRPASVQLNDIVFGNGRFVVVGNISWLSSTDGVNWNEQRSICGDASLCPGVIPPGGAGPGALALSSVVFGAGVLVTTGGVGGWLSSDGLTWSAAPSAVGGVFSHARFVARADQSHTVVVSSDGRSWAGATSFLVTDGNQLSCQNHDCIVLPDGIFIVPKPGDALPAARAPSSN